MSDYSISVAPRFGRIPVAEKRSGLRRSHLYKLARLNPGLFKKAGNATIVDLGMLENILAELPPAKIGATGSAT
jgi:hypothetical protein